MIQTIFVVLIVLSATTYLLFRLTPFQSKAKKNAQKKSCGCDGCPVAARK